MALSRGAELLGRFMADNGINKSSAGRAVGVRHVTVIDWLRGRKRPNDQRRHDIATWTGGLVPVESWALPEDTEGRAPVVPFDAKPTGTES